MEIRRQAKRQVDGLQSATPLIARDAEIQDLVDSLARGEHQALIGPPKSGKTSLAQAVLTTLESRGDWCCAAVTLRRTSGITNCIEDLLPVGQTNDAELGDALRLLQDSAQAEERRVVLFIDDFDEIARPQLFDKPENVGPALRTALEAAPDIAYLLAGSSTYLMRRLLASEDGSFHRFASITKLTPISAATWRDGLCGLFTERGFDITDAALDRVLELGERHPDATMAIAEKVCEEAAARDQTAVDAVLIDRGLRAVQQASRAIHESELLRTRSLGKHTLATAVRMAAGESAYEHLPPAVARQTLRQLEIAGIVEQANAREWRIASPLFRRHLQSLIDKPDPAGQMDQPAMAARPAVTAKAGHRMSSNGSPNRSARKLRRAGFRRPRAEEADAIGKIVAAAAASNGNGHRSGARARSADARGRRLGGFISRTVRSAPGRYWQLEANGRPIGGLVVYRPRALVGRRTPAGIDPLIQLVVLCIVVLLAVAGIGLLVAKEAWNWGPLGGLLLGCFAGCLLLSAPLMRAVFGRARASWIARRHGAALIEGLWSTPDEMTTVFDALAQQFPGTFLATHVDSAAKVTAYRSVGFRASLGRVLTGVLDPRRTPPVQPQAPRRSVNPRSELPVKQASS